MGPIQIMVFGFEDFNATGAIADELAALSDAGIITLIDARFLPTSRWPVTRSAEQH